MSDKPSAGYLLVDVRVLHNEERDEAGRWLSIMRGYEAETAALRDVFSLRLADPLRVGEDLETSLLRLCEHVYEFTNADADLLPAADAERARAYRAKHVRSLSIGDVVIVELPDSIHAFAVDTVGFKKIAPPSASSA